MVRELVREGNFTSLEFLDGNARVQNLFDPTIAFMTQLAGFISFLMTGSSIWRKAAKKLCCFEMKIPQQGLGYR